MEKYINILKTNKLFEDFSNIEIISILKCLSAVVVQYQKDETVIMIGDKISKVGIVLSGGLKIQKEDINGNVIILEEVGAGETFGEAFVCACVDEIPVSVWAMSNSNVMYIDYLRIMETCSSSCTYHIKLIKNMLKTMANRLITITQKMDIVQKNTIREKLMAFFEINMKKNNSNVFKIPFNRMDLSEYLGVNRSALSRELCKMRDDGIIEFNLNEFKVNV